MKIVIRTIEVGRHYGNIVGTVLEIVRLAHLETSNLGNGVFLVGVFQFTSEEAVLLHGLKRILRIDTGRAKEEEFLHIMSICLGNNVALDLHIHHQKVSTIKTVGHDATYKGSC